VQPEGVKERKRKEMMETTIMAHGNERKKRKEKNRGE
jgi:hypothetical protein